MSMYEQRHDTPKPTGEQKNGLKTRGLALIAMVGMTASLLAGCQSDQPNGAPTLGGPSPIATAPQIPGTATEQPTVAATTAPVQNPTTGNQATGNPNQGGNVTNNPTNLAGFDATILAAGYTPRPDESWFKQGFSFPTSEYNEWSGWSQTGNASTILAMGYVSCGGISVGLVYEPGEKSTGETWLVSHYQSDGSLANQQGYSELPVCN